MAKNVLNRSASSPRRRQAERRRVWSAEVTRNSNALDLERDVFTWSSPQRIAQSLKRSAESSTRRKADPFRSAMSMLNFYMNRAGRNLGARQRDVLSRAKDELRRAFGRAPKAAHGTRRRAA